LNRFASALHPAPKDSTILQADIHTDSASLTALLAGYRFDAVVDYLEAHPQFQTIDSESNRLWDKIINGYEKIFHKIAKARL